MHCSFPREVIRGSWVCGLCWRWLLDLFGWRCDGEGKDFLRWYYALLGRVGRDALLEAYWGSFLRKGLFSDVKCLRFGVEGMWILPYHATWRIARKIWVTAHQHILKCTNIKSMWETNIIVAIFWTCFTQPSISKSWAPLLRQFLFPPFLLSESPAFACRMLRDLQAEALS